MAVRTAKGPVGIRQFEDAVHEGIRRAYEDYPDLSDCDVIDAPEYYLTVKIADELKQLNLFVNLECSVKNTLRLAGVVEAENIRKELRGNGRFDFVAHSIQNKPRFMGEVKHPVAVLSRLDGDLERICGILMCGGVNSFQSGVIAFYAFKKKKKALDSLDKLIADIKARCTAASSELSCKVQMSWRPLARRENYASASVCMVVRPR